MYIMSAMFRPVRSTWLAGRLICTTRFAHDENQYRRRPASRFSSRSTQSGVDFAQPGNADGPSQCVMVSSRPTNGSHRESSCHSFHVFCGHP